MRLAKKEDYDKFIDKFIETFAEKYPDVCLYGYGSYFSDSCDFGRSDIDGGIILDANVITPKDVIFDIARIFQSSLSNNLVNTQFNLLDRGICREGRFLSYTRDYTDWLKRKAIVLSGSNFLEEMNGMDFKSGVLHTASFNLRKARNNMLYSYHLYETDCRIFVEKAGRNLETLAKFPKVLLWLQGEDVIVSREDARKKLSESLGIELDFVDSVNKLLSDPEIFYTLLSDRNKALEFLARSLETMESLILAYIQKYPNFSLREIRE